MNGQWWQIMDGDYNELAYPADRLNFWQVRKLAIAAAMEKSLQEVNIVKNAGGDIIKIWAIEMANLHKSIVL